MGTLDALCRQPWVNPITRPRATRSGKSHAAGGRPARPRQPPPGADRKDTKLLIISPRAAAMTPEIEKKLRTEFADHLVLEFDPKEDFDKFITSRATVVVAGGDGTVEFIVRKLADSPHPVGILSLGTFNNFAISLGLPTHLDKAIEVARHGQPR